ncbi:Teichuronic acid biosynthesis protein TuaB [Roseivivax jejudonensis]|uniref:Teichuronic acid biosynthesis protein TuaB n=1 Tax=Roseivivax jejudonensis TaxID=1529041 RepID=A0A1X6ZJR6_9RHOB|nr:oligosaccharide flippase family protein [Roseivivax jejudonensis]SLN53636.1 Teichuronic acid biosynthesis protein TuaB [Roseivivax jejudonensis]
MSDAPKQGAGNLSGRTAASSGWVGLARILVRLSDFLLLLVLARLLTPADFGLVTLATAIIGILDVLTDIPLTSALIRAERIERRFIDTAFTLGLLRGALLLALIGALTPAIAALYGDDRLLAVVPVLALGAALRVMQSPGMAHLYKALRFRESFVMEIGGKIASFGVAVAVALATRSYWALVLAPVVTQAVSVGLSYVIAPCRPRLSLAEFGFFWRFMGWLIPAQFAAGVAGQFDRLFLGAVVPKATLGFFGVANSLAALVEQSLRKAVTQPLISGFVMVEGQADRLRRGYRMADSAIVLSALPLYLIAFVFAEQIVAVALGAGWAPAAPYLQGLALAFLPALMRLPFRPLAMAAGRTDLVFAVEATALASRIVALPAGFALAGVPGLIGGIGVAGVVTAGAAMEVVRRICGMSWAAQMQGTVRAAGPAIVALFVAWHLERAIAPLTGVPPMLGLGGATLAFLATFYAGVVLTWLALGRPAGVEAKAVGAIGRRILRNS